MRINFTRVVFVLFAIALCACVKDVDQTTQESSVVSDKIISQADGAVAGTLILKVTPEVADKIEASVTRSGGVDSGLDMMNVVFNKIGVEHLYRLFPYEEEYEARHRAAGLHLWYGIKFDDTVSLERAAAELAELPEFSVVQYKHKLKSYRGRVVPGAKELTEQAEGTRATAAPYNDAYLSKQWHYNNTGTAFTNAKSGADVNAFNAWKIFDGTAAPEDIIVAVIDEPVQSTHPDLAANMWTNPKSTESKLLHGANFCTTSPSALDWSGEYYDKEYGYYEYSDHGTHVAGTIAAVNGNSVGVCGIAGGGSTGTGGSVKIMSCQIFSYAGNKSAGGDTYAAFVWAADRGAVIAQCSWGYVAGELSDSDWNRSADKVGVDYFIANNESRSANSPLSGGGIVIFAAGNDSATNKSCYPASYSKVIAVGAMQGNYKPAYYTNYDNWVDITTPGGDYFTINSSNAYVNCLILSTYLDSHSGVTVNHPGDRQTLSGSDGYGWMQGTSMACPHMSGVAALGLAYASKIGKKYTVDQYKQLLLTSVNDINQYMTGTMTYPDDNDSPYTVNLSGFLRKMGGGYADACKLLLAINGMPSVYVKTNTSTSVDMKNYFGGGAASLSFSTSMSQADKDAVGLSAVPTVSGSTMTLNCTKAGAAKLTVSTTIGGTTVSKDIFVVVRDNVSANGGWL